jgi:hypothetical protein
MLHQLSSLWQTDAGIALTGALVLFGWFSGVLFMLAWFWRRLTKPIDEERRLRLALEDADAQLVAAYAQKDRLALLVALQNERLVAFLVPSRVDVTRQDVLSKTLFAESAGL